MPGEEPSVGTTVLDNAPSPPPCSTVILWFKGGASLPGPGLPRLQSMGE